MKSDKEIEESVKKIFKYSTIEIRHSGDSVYVKVTQMYDKPQHGMGLREMVHKMCEAVGHEEMEEYDEIHESGCDTCDYGSCYGTEFRFWTPPKASKIDL